MVELQVCDIEEPVVVASGARGVGGLAETVMIIPFKHEHIGVAPAARILQLVGWLAEFAGFASQIELESRALQYVSTLLHTDPAFSFRILGVLTVFQPVSRDELFAVVQLSPADRLHVPV